MFILYSTALLVSMGLVLGILIAVFAHVFEIQEDTRVDRVTEVLPSYNCGVCGYPGCRHYAEAVVMQNAPHNKCRPGGKEVVVHIDLILDTGVKGQPIVQ